MKKTIIHMLDNIKKLILPTILILLISLTNSYAYLDPGTGGFIIQAILALGATIVFYLGYPVRIIKSFFNKIFKKKKKKV